MMTRGENNMHYEFMTSLLTFYMKGKIDVSDTMVRVSTPNSILKFIPLGSQKINVPITQIASCDTNFKLDIKAFGIGLLECVFGMLFMGVPLFGLLLLLIGFGSIISSMETTFEIQKTSADPIVIHALIFDKQAVTNACEAINQMTANRINDTNVRLHQTAQTDRIVEALHNSYAGSFSFQGQMKFCPGCGAPINEGAKFCTRCGAVLMRAV